MDLNDPGGQYNPYAAPAPDAGWEPASDYGEQRLAERSTRLGAALLDRLLYGASAVPGAVLGVLLFFNHQPSHHRSPEPDFATLMLMGGAIVALMLPLAAYQWYLISKTGQTLGKKWLGIRIVKLDGSPVDFVTGVVKRVWVMWLFGFIPYVGGCASLIDILMIFGDERRCLHDQIAGTKVVVAR